MAEFDSVEGARNYSLSNGATADLIALIGTATTEGLTSVSDPAELAVGDIAYVHAMGDLRRGVVTKLTKTKIHVTFTTRASADEAVRYNHAVRIQTTAAAVVYVKKAPATPAPVEIEEAPEAAPVLGADADAHLPVAGVPGTSLGEMRQAFKTEGAEEEDEEAPEATPAVTTAYFPGKAEGRSAEDFLASLNEPDEAPAGPTFQEDDLDADPEIDQPEELTLNSHGGKVDNMNNDANTETAIVRELTGSAVVKLLERVHERIRQNHPEVPEVVMITGAGIGFGGGKWGHFRPQGWTAQGEDGQATHRHEMFMAGETLAKGGRQVLQTMLHESAHALAEHRGEKDTSRQGRWHNQVFRKTAEEMGLEYKGAKADKTLGFSQVTLKAETVEEYKDLLEELDREIHLMVRLPGWLGGTAGSDGDDEDQGGENMGKAPRTGPASTSNNVKLTCLCEEPNIIRASKKVADKTVVRCDDCHALFMER